METRRVTPAARAGVFAAVCTLLAVAAHAPMSHQSVPLLAVGLGATTVFCAAWMAASFGERGLGSITALVGGSQLGLHLLFQVAQSSAVPPSPAPAMASMPGMDLPGSDPMASMSSAMGLTSGMTVAHVLAAALVAWWLRRGEAAVFVAVARQAGAAPAGAVLAVLAIAGPASAHVTVSPNTSAKGDSDVELTFRVPNEEDSANTTTLEVVFPTDKPITGVLPEPMPGWTAAVANFTLPTPIKTDDGTVTQVVQKITWTGGQIPPGQYQGFHVMLGHLPDDADSIITAALSPARSVKRGAARRAPSRRWPP